MPQRDWLTECFGAAITDIRQKLVEEPWFGRAVTAPLPEPGGSLAQQFGWDKPAHERSIQEAPAHGIGHEHDIDR